jgi:hypothetical protein
VSFAPRALLRRQTITVAVSSYELHLLIEALEQRACRAAENPETVDVADHWFCRVAALREAGAMSLGGDLADT